jgi:ribosomal protein S6--L-glutamate ligase
VKLLVLSRKPAIYSTRRLREAARIEGHACLVVDPLRCELRLGGGEAPSASVAGEELAGVDVVLPRLGGFALEFCLAVVGHFELMGVPVTAPSSGVALAKNKWASLQRLVQAGLPVPRTAAMRFATALPGIVDAFGGPPVVVKLTRGMQGQGVVLAESLPGAESLLDAAWGLGQDAVAQEFVEESRGRDVRVLVIGGEAVAAMRRAAKEGDFRSNIHRGGAGERVELTRDLRQLAERAAAAVGLPVAGVDLLESRRGWLVLEVNSSPGFQGLEEATERDIAVEIVRFAVSLAENRAGKSLAAR